MSTKHAAEQLKEIRREHLTLEHAMERRAYLFEKVTGTAVEISDDKVQTSPMDKHTIMMATLADLDTEIEERLQELKEKKERALQVLAQAGFDSEEHEIMYYRYIACLDWADISSIMYWSLSYVQKKHRKALQKLYSLEHT